MTHVDRRVRKRLFLCSFSQQTAPSSEKSVVIFQVILDDVRDVLLILGSHGNLAEESHDSKVTSSCSWENVKNYVHEIKNYAHGRDISIFHGDICH